LRRPCRKNAAIQRITPNEMRGQVTAIYLFMFIVFGALGSQLIRLRHSKGHSAPMRICGRVSWLTAVGAHAARPHSRFSRGIKPYGREVERLERETA